MFSTLGSYFITYKHWENNCDKNQDFNMNNSNKRQLYENHFFPSEGILLQRTHLYFNEDNTVIDKINFQSTANRLLETDYLGMHKPHYKKKLNKNHSFVNNSKSFFRRRHFYFNDDNTITDKSLTPLRAEKLFRHDFGQPIPNYNRCTESSRKDKGNFSFNESHQLSLREQTESSILKMSQTNSKISLATYDIKKHLLFKFGKNSIQRKHLYFDENGTSIDKSPSCSTAIELFKEDMKRSNLKLKKFTHQYENSKKKHFWFDEDDKIIDKSSNAITSETVTEDDSTRICQNIDSVSPQSTSLNFNKSFDSNRMDISNGLHLTNKKILNSKDFIKSNFSHSSNDDSEVLDQFTSLKIKEMDKELNIDKECVPILQLQTDLHVQDDAPLEFINESISMQPNSDNCPWHFQENTLSSLHRDSVKNLSGSFELLTTQSHEIIFSDDQKSSRSDQHNTKDSKTEEFLKLTFGSDSNKLFLTEDKEKEDKRCPFVSCQMDIKLPHKHFKQYHPNLPKWKRNTCLNLVYLNLTRDENFKFNRCLFCKSVVAKIDDHLNYVHKILSNTNEYEEMRNRCPTIFLNNTELLIEIVLNAFESFQLSKGLKRKAVNKQVLFIHDIMSSLSDDCEPEYFVGRLIASNIHSLISILVVQKQLFNKLLYKQINILRKFLKFLHIHSDIFFSIDTNFCEQVLPSWNVLELNKNQLILVSCKTWIYINYNQNCIVIIEIVQYFFLIDNIKMIE